MDTIALVENLIDDGGRLIEGLVSGGLDVSAAAWVKPIDDDTWHLYVVSKDLDTKGPLFGYGIAVDALRSLIDPWLTMSETHLVGAADAIGRSLIDVQATHPTRIPSRLRRTSVGGVTVEEVYVYPVSKRPYTELTGGEKQLLENLYNASALTVDDLPYTNEMERIHRDFVLQTGLAFTKRDLFKALLIFRKQGKLGVKALPSAEHKADAASSVATA